MNEHRRKGLKKAVGLLVDAMNIIESSSEEEQEYADNMPENLQGSERFEKAEQVACDLSDAAGEIEGIISMIKEAIEA